MNSFITFFENFARKASHYAGKPMTFMAALLIIILWAAVGPIFGYSDTWQLVINTSTTIITFLMVFLVQSAQNRDAKALQLKLDELIFKMGKADNIMIDIEELTEKELEIISARYKQFRKAKAPTGKAKKTLSPLNEIAKGVAADAKRRKKSTKN